jgi:hypothetical protein
VILFFLAYLHPELNSGYTDVPLSNICLSYNAASFLLVIILVRFSPLVYPDLTQASNVIVCPGDIAGVEPVLQEDASCD